MIATAKINIEAIIKKELPPLPSSALRVAALTQDINCSTRAIADAIGSDPALAARILRVANSPLYALERKVTTLPMAINTLGNDAIHTLIVVSSAADAFARTMRKIPMARALWSHSVAVGLAAREISTALNLRSGEESFLCGLLHDFGKIVLLHHDIETYQQTEIAKDERELLQIETDIYGYNHAQVGALMARRWGLPEEISYTIYNHHQPGEAGQLVFMARIIDIADELANSAGITTRPHQEARDVSAAESAIALRLQPEQLTTIWERANEQLDQLTQALESL